MFQHAVILGGLGQVGSLISRSLQDHGVAVTLIDVRPRTSNAGDGVKFLQSDIAACEPALRSAIASSDCVCVCLPEKIALQIAARLVAAMPNESLWIDTLSVKTGIVQVLEMHAGRLQILSINPMFAPAMGWAGGGVAVIELGSGPKSVWMKGLLATWGARLEAVSAEEHDRLTAAVQVATHAAVLSFGAALLSLDFDLEAALRLSTPPHRLLLTLLHRMTTQSAEVYWDIQAYHPLAGQVRKELRSALEQMDGDADKDEARRFAEMLARLSALFRTRNQLFTGWAKQTFALLRDHERPRQ